MSTQTTPSMHSDQVCERSSSITEQPLLPLFSTLFSREHKFHENCELLLAELAVPPAVARMGASIPVGLAPAGASGLRE